MLIREAKREDSSTILRFVKELAAYEKAEHEVLATKEMIESSIFSEHSTTKAIICESEGNPIGFAVYFFNYSTWKGKYGIYLEDLFVSPEHRGKGAGKALLVHIAGVAVANDCGRFEWSVLDWNTPSIEFYKSLGARPMDGWDIYRVDGDNLEKLAKMKG